MQTRRGNAAEPVSQDDVRKALGTLRELGGYEVTDMADGKALVRSIPSALDSSVNAAIEAAAAGGGAGYVTIETLRAAQGWTEGRAKHALDTALQQGVAWLDSGGDGQGGGDRFYFPCCWEAF